MTTTEQDARALTYLTRRLREETHGAREWDEAGIYAIVKRFVGHNLPLTVERVTRHASDPEAKTPGALERPFLPDAPKAQTRYPAKLDDECRTHPGEWADGCRMCAADRLAGETSRPRNPRRLDPERVKTHADRARAALRGGASDEE